jgi:aspartate aminotransferase
MINNAMRALGERRSVIRELFEYGLIRKGEVGEENVHDFSLGNPSVPAPRTVTEGLRTLIDEVPEVKLHAYTTAAGDASVREAIAEYITKTEGLKVDKDDLYMTVGAAAALTSTLGAVVTPGEEVVVIAPYFPEYKVFIERAGGVCVEVQAEKTTFQPDLDALEAGISERCAAVIINSPNNPTGAVLTEEMARGLAELLTRLSEKYGKPIYLISDEPYRELVYGGVKAPYLPLYYADTIVCYSYSKSLSIPGERIGYVLIPSGASDNRALYAAVAGSARSLGYVCAPSLLQRLIPLTLGTVADISVYDANRRLLLSELTKYGFEVVTPDGAFYLFMKSPSGDGGEMSERAKKHDLLIVPSESFGTAGYVRISYCVTTKQIKRALPAFKALAEEYFGDGK